MFDTGGTRLLNPKGYGTMKGSDCVCYGGMEPLVEVHTHAELDLLDLLGRPTPEKRRYRKLRRSRLMGTYAVTPGKVFVSHRNSDLGQSGDPDVERRRIGVRSTLLPE